MTATQLTVFRIVVSLSDIEPPVWRRVQLAADTTLHDLHRTIQLLFSWYDQHLYEFEAKGLRYQAPGPSGLSKFCGFARNSRRQQWIEETSQPQSSQTYR